jgi:hypothetical protein
MGGVFHKILSRLNTINVEIDSCLAKIEEEKEKINKKIEQDKEKEVGQIEKQQNEVMKKILDFVSKNNQHPQRKNEENQVVLSDIAIKNITKNRLDIFEKLIDGGFIKKIQGNLYEVPENYVEKYDEQQIQEYIKKINSNLIKDMRKYNVSEDFAIDYVYKLNNDKILDVEDFVVELVKNGNIEHLYLKMYVVKKYDGSDILDVTFKKMMEDIFNENKIEEKNLIITRNNIASIMKKDLQISNYYDLTSPTLKELDDIYMLNHVIEQMIKDSWITKIDANNYKININNFPIILNISY